MSTTSQLAAGDIPSFAHVIEAHERIAPYIHRTPVLTSQFMNSLAGAELFFKCENLQKAGAFKARGASNAVFGLTDDQAANGVATHSSGNHGQSLAYAAGRRGIPCTVVMPHSAPKAKKDAVAGYGARVVECEPSIASREETFAQVLAETGAEFVHPFNDGRVIAGQGTAALELFEEVPDLDVIMAPVGGGGLLSGTALTSLAVSPATRVIAGEPAGADDAYRSLQTGQIQPSVQPKTIADGLLTSLGEITFAIIRRHVEKILTVQDETIIKAMRLVWERMKIIVEPSAAVPLAALLEHPDAELRGKRVGIIFSGGNVDLGKLPF